MRKKRGKLAAQLGLRLRELRDEAELTQAELAAKAGLTSKYISEVENGHRDLRLTTIERLAHALRTKPDELMRFSADVQARAQEDSRTLDLTLSRMRAMLRPRQEEIHQHVLSVVREVLRLLDAVS